MAQITTANAQTAATLAQKLVGSGVTVLNPTIGCNTLAEGTFIASSNSIIGIDSGITLTSGYAQNSGFGIGIDSPSPEFADNGLGGPGDGNLTNLAGIATHDRCKLEFDFIPQGDTVKFDYVFASEEYDGPHGNFNCSINDVFGFFISGPGYATAKNIALVPGTNIPVGVSTINDGVGAFPGSSCYINTNNNGPYTQYYNDNNGTDFVYSGYTDVLTAVATVIPCDTFHLKLAIADASDDIYDSGVFLKAGSLTSNTLSITPIGGAGLNAVTPTAVRGCLPGQFVFNRAQASPTPLTIHFNIGGTATNGTDYSFIADSVVIPANQTTAYVPIYGQIVVPPTGPENVQIDILSPYTCNGTPVIIGTANIIILDTIPLEILTPDTSICQGQQVHIRVAGNPAFVYQWTPTAGLTNPNIDTTIASPGATTTYTLSATLPGTGCPPVIDTIRITVLQGANVSAGPDLVTCLGTPVQLNAVVTPLNQVYTYVWSGPAGLSNTSIPDPVFTPTDTATQLTYIVTANPGVSGCSGHDTINIRVLPNDFNLYNHDTTICMGASVQINAEGDAAFTYLWTPTSGVSAPTTTSPVITPGQTTTYTLTASYPTCPAISHSLTITVEPSPVVTLGPDREKCQWDTLHLHAAITPGDYPSYTYLWTPDSNLNVNNSADVIFNGMQDADLTFTVKTPAGCTATDDLHITVHQGNFATLMPGDTGICAGDSLQLTAGGGIFYNWMPGTYLSDTGTANPVVHPLTDISYTGIVTDQYGCLDTVGINVTLHPAAVLSITDSIRLWPGDSVQLEPLGNCLYFAWFPPLGLSNASIANPIAMPPVNTRYYVTGTTEWGCRTVDSVDVNVSLESIINVPNAFSPGNGPNNNIQVAHSGIASLNYFRIFNRWGQLVFSGNNINEGWNGQLNNEPQPMGVYIYEVEAVTNLGTTVHKQGNITLIR